MLKRDVNLMIELKFIIVFIVNGVGWRIYAPVNQPSLVQIMACSLDGAKLLSEPVL